MNSDISEKIRRLIYEPIRRFTSIAEEWDDLFLEFGKRLKLNRFSRRKRLVSISPPRSMTSFLFQSLKDVPGIHVPSNKETNYFWGGWQHVGEPDQENVMGATDELSVLDISPSYATLPVRAIREIAASYPDLSLLLMLRDPVARTISHMVFQLIRPSGTGFTYDEINRWPKEAWLISLASFAQLYSPVRVLDRWLAVYPPEQINVCFCETLVKREPRDLEALGRFLEVETLDFDFTEVVASLDYSMVLIPDEAHRFLRSVFAADVEILAQRVGHLWSRTVPECWFAGDKANGTIVIHHSTMTGLSAVYENGVFRVVDANGVNHWTGTAAIPALGLSMSAESKDMADERVLEIHFAAANGRL